MSDESNGHREQSSTSSGAAEAPAKAAPESTPKDRAEAAGYPPDSGPERDVIAANAAMIGSAPLRFLLLVLLGLAFATGSIWMLIKGIQWAALLFAIALFADVVGIAVWKVLTLRVGLAITNKRTTKRLGLLSRSTSEVLHDNIRNVKIDQSLWQRVWNVGTLMISSSGQDDIEIEMKNVPRPRELAKIIDLYRPLD